MIEAQSRVVTNPSAPLPADKLCSFEQMRESAEHRTLLRLPAGQPASSNSRPKPGNSRSTQPKGVDDAWLAALALMKFVYGFLKYQSRSTHVHTHMNEVVKDRRGVCQDFAHLMARTLAAC